jgi:hypothetical protein
MKTLIVLAFVAVAAFLLMKKRGADKPGKHKGQLPAAGKRGKARAEQEPRPYRATVIVPGAMACDAARELADKPYLDAEKSTPALPLPNCTAPNCRCKYVHRDDRREEDIDRRFESGMQTEMYRTSGQPERRGSRGRRKSD